MESSMIVPGDALLLLIGIAFFGVLFPIIKQSLQRSQLFKDGPVSLVAFCVTILSLIGMHQVFFPSESAKAGSEGTGHPGIPPLLVPYAALGLAMLIMLLLMLLGKLVHSRKAKRHTNTAFPMDLPYPSKPKEEWPIPQPWPIKKHGETGHDFHLMNDYPIKTSSQKGIIEAAKLDIKSSNEKGIRHEDK